MAGESWSGGTITGGADATSFSLRPRGGYIPLSDIPNVPATVAMPSLNYPKMPNIRYQPVKGEVDMESRGQKLMQKPLPSSFEEAGAMRAESAGKGQMAVGKAISSAGEDIGKAFGMVSNVLTQIRDKQLESKDAVDSIRAQDNREIVAAKFKDDAATNRWGAAEAAKQWPKYLQDLQKMNAPLGVTRFTKDVIAARDEGFAKKSSYQFHAAIGLKQIKDDADLLASKVDTGINNKDPDSVHAATEANDTAFRLEYINEAQHAENKEKLTTAHNQYAESEAMNLNPWEMEKQTASVMKGGKSELFPHLGNQPERAAQLNGIARQRINILEKQGSETYEDRLSRGDIKFEDRAKVAEELHVRPSEAKSINARADNPDPVYDPEKTNSLETKLASYQPGKMPGELETLDKYYELKAEIRTMPSNRRDEMNAELNDALNAALSRRPKAAEGVIKESRGELFAHIEEMDTGLKGSFFGDDGTNHEPKGSSKRKVVDPVANAEHYGRIASVHNGIDLFIKAHPDATLTELNAEAKKLMKQYMVPNPSGAAELEKQFQGIDETIRKVPVTSSQLEKERKRLAEAAAVAKDVQIGGSYVIPAPEESSPQKTTYPPSPPSKGLPSITPGTRGVQQPLKETPAFTAAWTRAAGEQEPGEGPAAKSVRITTYVPGEEGQEGSNKVAGRKGPSYTMEDYLEGRAPHVTVAMDEESKWQGRYIASPSYPGVIFKVEDTGTAFNKDEKTGKPGKGEAALDIAFRDKSKKSSYDKEGAAFAPITDQEAANIVNEQKAERQKVGSLDVPMKQDINPNVAAMGRHRSTDQITRIVVHGDVMTSVPNLIAYARKADRGYNYYIARDGTITQVIPDDRIAYHILGGNTNALGVVLAGADNGRMPTKEQEVAAKLLISKLGRQYGIDPQNVRGHGEWQPGHRDVREGGNVARDIRQHGYA